MATERPTAVGAIGGLTHRDVVSFPGLGVSSDTSSMPARGQSGGSHGSHMINLINWSASFAHRLCRGLLPRSLISFLMVGALGMGVHLAIMKTGMVAFDLHFRAANLLAMIGAATFNYYLNNLATFSDKTLSGRSVFVGYALYMGVTSLGLVISMSVSSVAYAHGYYPVVAAIFGIVCGSLWNYLMSYTFVWRMISRYTSRRAG
jgi:putative flippase GtrA